MMLKMMLEMMMVMKTKMTMSNNVSNDRTPITIKERIDFFIEIYDEFISFTNIEQFVFTDS
jgi:hypothetical protein